ncbi:hypothetical protein C8N40_110131 [Pontibacter mucosus]|uniref:Uncharacterized protein n=1 Tax=Pontibacter mucosus TaxID=1649266 RepID=A0A2T5YDS6_9BACT|nr:hypothetical protein C8N40_110131 [Pontibacter mucosus]
MKLERSLIYILLSELLFTILPVFIVLIVRSYEGNYKMIFYNTEWSIMAIILYGQSIVKFSSGISNSKAKFRWQLVSLIISIIIIFGLIPSITVLIINLLNSGENFAMYMIQTFLFVVSVFCYFIIGYLGQKMLEE